MLIPLLLIMSSKENTNYSKLKLIAFSLGIISIIFSEVTIRLISDKQNMNYIIAIIPVLLLLLTYFLFYKKLKFK